MDIKGVTKEAAFLRAKQFVDCSLLMQADAEDGGVVLVMVCGGRLGQ